MQHYEHLDHRNIKGLRSARFVAKECGCTTTELYEASVEAIKAFAHSDNVVAEVNTPHATIYADYGFDGHIVAYLGDTRPFYGIVIAREKLGLGLIRYPVV